MNGSMTGFIKCLTCYSMWLTINYSSPVFDLDDLIIGVEGDVFFGFVDW